MFLMHAGGMWLCFGCPHVRAGGMWLCFCCPLGDVVMFLMPAVCAGVCGYVFDVRWGACGYVFDARWGHVVMFLMHAGGARGGCGYVLLPAGCVWLCFCCPLGAVGACVMFLMPGGGMWLCF